MTQFVAYDPKTRRYISGCNEYGDLLTTDKIHLATLFPNVQDATRGDYQPAMVDVTESVFQNHEYVVIQTTNGYYTGHNRKCTPTYSPEISDALVFEAPAVPTGYGNWIGRIVIAHSLPVADMTVPDSAFELIISTVSTINPITRADIERAIDNNSLFRSAWQEATCGAEREKLLAKWAPGLISMLVDVG